MQRNHPNLIMTQHPQALRFIKDIIVLAWQNVHREHLRTAMAKESNRTVMALLRRDINQQMVIGGSKHAKSQLLGVKLINGENNKEVCWFTINGVPGEIRLVSKPKGRNKQEKSALHIIGQDVLELPGLGEVFFGKLYIQVENGGDDCQPRSISLVLTTNFNAGWDQRGEKVIAAVDLEESLLTTTTDRVEDNSQAEDEDFFDSLMQTRDTAEANKELDLEQYEQENPDEREMGGNAVSSI